MDYHLQIAEIVPLTEEEKEKRDKNMKGNYYPDVGYVGNSIENKRRGVLDVMITAEQWEKIKLAVLEHKA